MLLTFNKSSPPPILLAHTIRAAETNPSYNHVLLWLLWSLLWLLWLLSVAIVVAEGGVKHTLPLDANQKKRPKRIVPTTISCCCGCPLQIPLLPLPSRPQQRSAGSIQQSERSGRPFRVAVREKTLTWRDVNMKLVSCLLDPRARRFRASCTF